MAIKLNKDQELLNGGATLKKDNSNSGFSYGKFNLSAPAKSLQTQAYENKSYVPSENVSNAYANYVNSMQSKPADFTSQYQPALNDTMQKILNREKFSYDLNGDALYQQYKDKYITQGKAAMQDTLGQASALTGGYGNSYASTAGNQAYQGYLQQLNDRIPELYQLALDTYNAEGDALNNQYSMLNNAYQNEYGQYRDTISDWQNQVGMNADLYNNLYSQEYGQFTDDRTNTNNLYNMAYNQEYGQYGDDRNMAWNAYQSAVDQSQFADKMAYQAQRDAVSDDQWQKEYELSVDKLKQSNNEAALQAQIKALEEQVKATDGASNGEGKVDTTNYSQNSKDAIAKIDDEETFRSKYGTYGKTEFVDYEQYVDTMIEKYMKQMNLTDDEAADVIRYFYGKSR